MLDHVWRPAAAVAGLALIAGLGFVGSAQAESIQKQCSDKYQAAKSSNSLNGETWNQFYKQCAADLKGGGAAATTAPATTSAPPPSSTTTEAAPAEKKHHWWQGGSNTTSAPPSSTTSGNVVFPSAISPQYKALSAGKGRFKTCDDQYRANKANGGNGGLKWIQKGGGYYSECNKHLKGMM